MGSQVDEQREDPAEEELHFGKEHEVSANPWGFAIFAIVFVAGLIGIFVSWRMGAETVAIFLGLVILFMVATGLTTYFWIGQNEDTGH